MELIKNLKYMCRICAVNIKKRRSSSSAVSIFDTPQLIDKLKKYLNMDIIYNDELPKSICSVCYKKVEAIHALAALAKKTENFLNDFIKIAQNNLKQSDSEPFPTSYQNEFNNFNLLDGNTDDCLPPNNLDDIGGVGGVGGGGCCDDDDDDEETPPPPQLNEPEEVVLNFTLNDPLTKNIQKKIVVAKQKKLQQQNQHYNHPLVATTTNTQQFTDEILRELQTTIKRKELNNSLAQKRQNLKMILNNSNTSTTSSSSQNNNNNNNNNHQHHHQQQQLQQQHRQSSPPDPLNNFKSLLPTNSSTNHLLSTPNTSNLSHNIQSNPILFPPSNAATMQQHSINPQQLLDSPIMDAAAQMMNDCLNLGSVIKDMDLLKLILKALRWQFNQETLHSQINRLKSTRFRDVMIDPNLLQDTDLMQILSSYLSPMLLQQQSPPIPNNSTSSNNNILPPSVSYKIPAETSVRLVSVPRDDPNHHHHHHHHHQQQQQHHHHHQQDSSYSSSSRKHSRSSDHQRYEHHKSKKSKSEQKHRRSLLHNYGPPHVIVVSDDESCCSDNIQRFEVNVDPMLYFHGADSSLENSNESTMITMGYFKQLPLNAEVTLQKRKKQKRKQSLKNNNSPTEKTLREQDHVIIDESGKQPIKFSNEISCVPTSRMLNHPPIQKYKHDYNMPSTSAAAAATATIPNQQHFQFTTPKKRRRLNTYKSSSNLMSSSSSLSKDIPSQGKITMAEFSKIQNLQTVVKVEKNLEDVSIIAVNKSYESTKKLDFNTSATLELLPSRKQQQHTSEQHHSKTPIVTITSSGSSNSNNDRKSSDATKKDGQHYKSVIEKVGHVGKESTSSSSGVGNSEQDKHKTTDTNNKKNSTQIDKPDLDDGDSRDTNDQLVIDEGYDDDKLKDDEIKVENVQTSEQTISTTAVEKESKSNTSNETANSEESEVKTNESNNDKSTDNSETTVDNMSLLRRSRRQTKIKEPFKPYLKIKTNNSKKPPVTTTTTEKNKTVSTRGKTRQQEEKPQMQTRNRNVSQRGREQKPSSKYYKRRC